MTRTPRIIALVAAAALAGCNKENHTIVAGPDVDTGSNVASSGPVELPPAVTASKSYRCGDNKIVYVNWLSDNKSATIRTEEGGAPTQITAPEPGKPMTSASGFTLTGTASASSVKLTVPGRGTQSCKG